MRKISAAIAFLIFLLLTGCSKSNKGDDLENIDVHSEQEMLDFALSYLDQKYDEQFVIDKSYYKYKHKNGHEDAPMVLNARFHPIGDDHLVGAFYLEEPNIISDNYSIIMHQYEVEDVLFPEFAKQDLSAVISIDASQIRGDLDKDISAEEIIYDDRVTIQVYQPVNRNADMKENLPLIRKWLDYLYTCDYEWDFGLIAEDDNNYILFQINKSDCGYQSADDWSDEELLYRAEIMEDFTKEFKEKYDKTGE